METTLPTSLTIKVHSFVDLITNSSTEIYIQASEKTIESVKQLVNNILEMGNSKLTCDDLFDISLSNDGISVEDYEEYRSIRLVVKAKSAKSEVGAATASILSRLTSLFSISASYNG